MIGRPITELLPEDRQDELEKILVRLRAGEAVDHFETTRRHKDGRIIQVALTVSPLLDSGDGSRGHRPSRTTSRRESRPRMRCAA